MRSTTLPALLTGMLTLVAATSLPAQDASPAPVADLPTEAIASPVAQTPPAAAVTTGCCTLADGTFLDLEIAETLSSKTAQRGQRFKLRLAQPVSVDGVVVLPAGIEGEGEVVHTARARGGGKPGELLLAARFLDGPNGQIRLRGLKLGGRGRDTTGAAIGVAIALGPVAFLVRGGEIEIASGSAAHAKLAGPQPYSPIAPMATTTPAPAETPPSQMDASAAQIDATTGKDSPTP